MKKLIALILALVFTLSFTACGADETASDIEYVTNNGKIVVGITDFAPMDYEDENGEWIGFDADMAKELGVEYNKYKAIERGEIKMPSKLMDKFNEIINRGKKQLAII